MLLTDQDLMNHHRQSDLVTALNSLLDMRMIPILNGNDAVAIEDSTKNVNNFNIAISLCNQACVSSLLKFLLFQPLFRLYLTMTNLQLR